MVASRADLIDAVERSPQAFSVHDRDGWVGAFTPDARIEDPVGSRPHVGHAEIYRFYDTFIGPRDIAFHRDLDIVSGTTVVRDLELEVAMGAAVTMHIPAFLRYDLREHDGQWQIAELRAYWELPAMVLQFLRSGPRAASPALRLSRGLLTNQKVRGTAGFMAGFRRVGTRHKKLVEVLLGGAADGDAAAVRGVLSPGAATTLGDDEPLDVADFVERLRGARPLKTIGAGFTVVTSLGARDGRGVLFADVDRRGRAIDRIRYFPA